MKIIINNKAFVQRKDIIYLNQSDLNVPKSIFIKAFENNIDNIFDDSIRYEFIEFNDPKEIAFFKSLNWLIDYNEVKKLDEEELITLGENAILERNAIIQKYNSMSDEKKKKNKQLLVKADLLVYKIYSLRNALWAKQGYIKINLPENLDEKNLEKRISKKKKIGFN